MNSKLPYLLSTAAIGVVGLLSGFSASAVPKTKPIKVAQLNAAAGTNLNVQVTGLRNLTGQVCFSLFTDSKAFPQEPDRAVINRCQKITANPMVVSFKNLKPGNYAIALIHDENGDRVANRNFIGMPKEGFGFSKNPPVRTTAPKFTDSEVAVAGPNTTVKIQMQYLLNR